MHVLSFLFDKHLDKTILAIAVALAIVLLSLGEQSQIESGARDNLRFCSIRWSG